MIQMDLHHLLGYQNGINNLGNSNLQMLIKDKSNGLDSDKSSEILLTNVQMLNESSTNTTSNLEETAASLEEMTLKH